jgi:hypothetical protein
MYVMPANTGIQIRLLVQVKKAWIPASAGMTEQESTHVLSPASW